MLLDLAADVKLYVVGFGLNIGGLLFLAGILWAPIGALLIVRLNKSMREGTAISFVHACQFSVLLLLPWLYQFLSAIGRVPSRRMVVAANVAVVILWLTGPLAYWIDIALTDILSPNPEQGTLGPSTKVVWFLLSASFALLNAGLMYRAIGRLRRHDHDRGAGELREDRDAISSASLAVFRGAALSYLLMIPMLLLHLLLVFATWEWSF